MISTQAAMKIPADVFQALDDYHAALAVALQKKGRVIIEDKPAPAREGTTA